VNNNGNANNNNANNEFGVAPDFGRWQTYGTRVAESPTKKGGNFL
jgi:hypothetical protein